ncbi:MAG: holo-ACP synthase [Candidatus Babeliales bacterium]|jgi:phosphopantetheine--protein transferase-like protein
MIRGVGVDIVSIQRFQRWKTFPPERLNTIFSAQEISDCRADDKTLLSDKLAARFAAKEAFYKALSVVCVSYGLTATTFSLRSICTHVEVRYGTWGVPVLHVAWDRIEQIMGARVPRVDVHLSLSHERDMAVAFVVLEEK